MIDGRVMPEKMLPSALLRLYAQAGASIASSIQGMKSTLLVAPDDLRIRVEKKLTTEMLNENGLPFPPSEMRRIFADVFDPKNPAVPSLYRAFIAFMLITGELERLDAKGSETTLLSQIHWACRWASFGLPVFQLTHGLAAALLLTEPPPFDAENFKLPFDAFAIVLPQNFIPFLDGDKKSWGECVIVHRSLGYVTKADSETDVLEVDIRSRERNIWHRQPVEEFASVEQANAVLNADDSRQQYPLVEDDFRTIEVTLRLVRNLVAWVEAHGSGEPEGKRSTNGNYARDSKGNVLPTTFVLGREVKLSPELRRVAAEVALGEKHGGPGWKLRMRYCVRGHWKMQAHGEGHKERKRIFVAPYWKGPEGAAAWAHVFTANP